MSSAGPAIVQVKSLDTPLHYSGPSTVSWHGRTELTEVPGGYERCCTHTPDIVSRGVQNSQKFRVGV